MRTKLLIFHEKEFQIVVMENKKSFDGIFGNLNQS